MPRTIDLTGMTAIGYLRVSDEEQAGERQTSLADQRAAIAVLAARLGVAVGRFFEDVLPGATMEFRPGMRSLIASCTRSPRQLPAFVLVLNDSRWGRFTNSEEATYWRVHVAKLGWHVQFAELDDVQDETVRPVLRAIAQSQASLYRKTLSANVRRGARGTAEQGYWQAQAPFGYVRMVVFPADRARVLGNHVPKATDEKLILTPDPDEGPIVQSIFVRYVTAGESLTSVLEWATAAHPSRLWTRLALHRMLTNPAYVGDVVWGRVRVEPGRRAHRSEAEHYGKRDAHVPLVSRDLFAAAAVRLATNKRRTRGVRSDYILSGLVRCRCGRTFTGAGDTGKRGAGPVYACSSRGAHASRRCAYPGAVTKRLIEATALSVLTAELSSGVHRRAMANAIDQAIAEVRASTRTSDEITRELELVQQRQRRLIAAIEAEACTPAEVADRMAALRRDADRLERERAQMQLLGANGIDGEWREQLVTQSLDFRSMAAELKGPALRELVQLWLKDAEFNTTTRELTMEIRRVPAVTQGMPPLFVTEGEPSGTKGKGTSGLETTVIRKVIVGRVA